MSARRKAGRFFENRPELEKWQAVKACLFFMLAAQERRDFSTVFELAFLS